MLTDQQQKLLLYLTECLEETGVCPSFDEMRLAMGLQSKSGVHRLISGLEERGLIRRLPNRARALEIVEKSATSIENAVRAVPFYGRIAAGAPLEAIADLSETVEVPATLLRPARQYYALEVRGDSMKNAGILEGDIALIEADTAIQNGNIAVALVDEEEVTLKEIRLDPETICLVPHNPDYSEQVYLPGRVKLQGKLAGIIRKYA